MLILLVTLIINGISGSKKTTSNSTTYSSSNSSSNSSSSSSSNSSSYSKVGYTDSELEILACSALYDELMTAKSKQGVPLSNWYNIDATTYSIGSIKGNSSDGWTVKGTFNLYNDYGVYRKSGTFTARISGYGFATCTISLD